MQKWILWEWRGICALIGFPISNFLLHRRWKRYSKSNQNEFWGLSQVKKEKIEIEIEPKFWKKKMTYYMIRFSWKIPLIRTYVFDTWQSPQFQIKSMKFKWCRHVMSFKSSYVLRRPQNFAKSPPYFWLALHRTKVRWRFRKIFDLLGIFELYLCSYIKSRSGMTLQNLVSKIFISELL